MRDGLSIDSASAAGTQGNASLLFNLSQLFDSPSASNNSPDGGDTAPGPAGGANASVSAPVEVGAQERDWANQLLSPFEQHRGPYVQTCGHAMHAECLQKYVLRDLQSLVIFSTSIRVFSKQVAR